MFLANSSLPSLSPSSNLPTLTAQTHFQTQAHILLPLSQCKVYSNEIQLIKKKKKKTLSIQLVPFQERIQVDGLATEVFLSLEEMEDE